MGDDEFRRFGYKLIVGKLTIMGKLTGGMYLNVASKSLYPFLTFGKKHLVDDPVALLSTNGSKEYFAEYLKLAIADDICQLPIFRTGLKYTKSPCSHQPILHWSEVV